MTMYVVLQLGTIWILYDRETTQSRILEKKEIEVLTTQFGNIVGKGALNVIQLQKINPSRLMKMPATGYVILRVGEMWTLYEGGKPGTEILDKIRVASFSDTFPRVIDQQMLNAIAIDTLNPNKLTNESPKPISSTRSSPSPPAGGRDDGIKTTAT